VRVRERRTDTNRMSGFGKIFGAVLEGLFNPQKKIEEKEVKLLLDAVMLLRPEVLAEGWMLMRYSPNSNVVPSDFDLLEFDLGSVNDGIQGELISSLEQIEIGVPYITQNGTPLVRSSKSPKVIQLGSSS